VPLSTAIQRAIQLGNSRCLYELICVFQMLFLQTTKEIPSKVDDSATLGFVYVKKFGNELLGNIDVIQRIIELILGKKCGDFYF
jgi:hypothetical protein